MKYQLYLLLTIVGDSGVGSGCTDFVPNFPVSSPYVTGVGATKIQDGAETTASFSGGGYDEHVLIMFSSLLYLFMCLFIYLLIYRTNSFVMYFL